MLRHTCDIKQCRIVFNCGRKDSRLCTCSAHMHSRNWIPSPCLTSPTVKVKKSKGSKNRKFLETHLLRYRDIENSDEAQQASVGNADADLQVEMLPDQIQKTQKEGDLNKVNVDLPLLELSKNELPSAEDKWIQKLSSLKDAYDHVFVDYRKQIKYLRRKIKKLEHQKSDQVLIKDLKNENIRLESVVKTSRNDLNKVTSQLAKTTEENDHLKEEIKGFTEEYLHTSGEKQNYVNELELPKKIHLYKSKYKVLLKCNDKLEQQQINHHLYIAQLTEENSKLRIEINKKNILLDQSSAQLEERIRECTHLATQLEHTVSQHKEDAKKFKSFIEKTDSLSDYYKNQHATVAALERQLASLKLEKECTERKLHNQLSKQKMELEKGIIESATYQRQLNSVCSAYQDAFSKNIILQT